MNIFSKNTITQFKAHINKGSKLLNIKVSNLQADLMAIHARELLTWNKKINLTAIKEPLQVAEKHFIDSIIPTLFFNTEETFIDLGAGGGFPGIPIKIMNPSLKVVLVDSSRKKVNFLKHVIRMLNLENIDAVHSRVEHLHDNDDYKKKFDAVISRAFTQLPDFASLANPFLNKKGIIYAMKGKQGKDEITSEVIEKYDIQFNYYQLPFEKSDRQMIQLSVKL
ncbi:MAG: 16S rRNA (guanine(527)-N(7))-methyltransferase RsmG [Desulfobacteraceae bacterium]|nr:16S rRNA (guanine(527)-N(7))-methyltransferase RsmG [Desulfobacteraceae bacterium]